MQQIKERRLPMIDRGDIRQAPTVAAISKPLPGAGYGQFDMARCASLIAKFKEAGGTVRKRLMARVTAIISRSGYLHHRLPVMGC